MCLQKRTDGENVKKKKKKMKMVHCVVFSSCWGNVNACDNVGKPGLLISRNKKKLRQMAQFNQVHTFNGCLMLILDGSGVLLTS